MPEPDPHQLAAQQGRKRLRITARGFFSGVTNLMVCVDFVAVDYTMTMISDDGALEWECDPPRPGVRSTTAITR